MWKESSDGLLLATYKVVSCWYSLWRLRCFDIYVVEVIKIKKWKNCRSESTRPLPNMEHIPILMDKTVFWMTRFFLRRSKRLILSFCSLDCRSWKRGIYFHISIISLNSLCLNTSCDKSGTTHKTAYSILRNTTQSMRTLILTIGNCQKMFSWCVSTKYSSWSVAEKTSIWQRCSQNVVWGLYQFKGLLSSSLSPQSASGPVVAPKC